MCIRDRRKCAHISEYAVFHVTILYALYQWGLRGRKWLTAGFFLVFFYACTDEIHQLFVPGRSGQFTDVMIDCIGAALITAGLVWRAVSYTHLDVYKRQTDFDFWCLFYGNGR